MVDVRVDPGGPVVRLTGELSAETTDAFVGAVHEAFRAARGDVVLDLRDVHYLDSSGVRAIVDCWRSGRADGRRIMVDGQTGIPAQVLDVCGLTDLLGRGSGAGD